VGQVDLEARIPNNVALADDRRLQRALEHWQPAFLDWWRVMGPEGFQDHEVYLRTAVDVGAKGWAHFDHVKMLDYRWGIFLAPPEPGRLIPFGDHLGEPAWQEVPGELRNNLRRIIVTQGDTEPASVEQQRGLGATSPSGYDLRNLFQVNVEEGRHLWAMVYLLHTFFGRDGREEAEMLLERRSGDADRPRILGAFNEPISTWLDYFMFTMFTDRDGKYQLLCLAESGFDPLARTCRFMLTEEAHHMFVGETGIQRIVERTIELMQRDPNEDARAGGGIDLEMIQRYLNFWFSHSLDLFGGEVSTNAANYFASGIKGRAYEDRYEDHAALAGTKAVERFEDGHVRRDEVATRLALNEEIRDQYVADCQRGVDKWNRSLERAGLGFRFALPSRRFERHIGTWAAAHATPAGELVEKEAWETRREQWLPTDADRAWLAEIEGPARIAPGEIASWLTPPKRGIDGKTASFEYVRR
jgi:benzoyl-CoA 2,3-dioxygenase component B